MQLIQLSLNILEKEDKIILQNFYGVSSCCKLNYSKENKYKPSLHKKGFLARLPVAKAGCKNVSWTR